MVIRCLLKRSIYMYNFYPFLQPTKINRRTRLPFPVSPPLSPPPNPPPRLSPSPDIARTLFRKIMINSSTLYSSFSLHLESKRTKQDVFSMVNTYNSKSL